MKKELIDDDFLYYLLKSDIVQQEIYKGNVGSTQPKLPLYNIKFIELNIPSVPEQRAIASVLSSLDDKIDLLHRQNETLEQLAETIFRQWFVEEAQDDWEIHPITDYIKIVGGGTPKSSRADYWDGPIYWLSGGDVSNNHKAFVLSTDKSISQDGLDNSSCKLLPKFATVISARGTVGKYCLLGQPMTFSQSNYGILPKIENCYFFTYLLLSHFISELLSNAYGSVFDTITTNSFENIQARFPDAEKIIEFEKGISVIFQKKLANIEQINMLTKQRDALLPKLMSGEVRVKH
jgi:type I restriction enzyme S subunit